VYWIIVIERNLATLQDEIEVRLIFILLYYALDSSIKNKRNVSNEIEQQTKEMMKRNKEKQ